jgi:hypothetical protein
MEQANKSSGPSETRIVPRDRVLTAANTIQIGKPGSVPENQIQVVPVVDDDVIQAVEVRCTCGCQLRIELEYATRAVPAIAPSMQKKVITSRHAAG